MRDRAKPVKLHTAAQTEIDAIYSYTSKTWGEDQADLYVSKLIAKIHHLSDELPWYDFELEDGQQISYVQHEHHSIFFKDQPEQILILAVLHQRRDVRGQLREALQSEN